MSDILDRELVEADRWVTETASAIGRHGHPFAQSALRAVLQALRDSLSIGQAVEFGNRLPALVRGVYYEGWKPARGGSGLTRESFLKRVGEGLTGIDGLTPESATSAVFRALRTLQEGKMAHLAAEWPPVLLEFGLLGSLTSDGNAEPSKIDKVSAQIQAAADRAALDGWPAGELPNLPETPSLDERTRRTAEGSVFDESVQKLNLWLKKLVDSTGWSDRDKAFSVLRAVLQALRDRLTRDEAIHLGAQLPAAVRGFYYEDWHAEPRPSRERTLENFRTSVQERLAGHFDAPPDDASGAVFRLLADLVSEGELDDVRGQLPEEIRNLWPVRRLKPRGRSRLKTPRTVRRNLARKAFDRSARRPR